MTEYDRGGPGWSVSAPYPFPDDEEEEEEDEDGGGDGGRYGDLCGGVRRVAGSGKYESVPVGSRELVPIGVVARDTGAVGSR